jgi:hypothetical protein
VHILNIWHIGKEANKLDEVQAGLIGNLDDVLTEYHSPDEELFRRLVLPRPRPLLRTTARTPHRDGPAHLDRIRHGQKPRPVLREVLTALAFNIAGAELARTPHEPSQQEAAGLPRRESLAVLAAWHDQFRTGSRGL